MPSLCNHFDRIVRFISRILSSSLVIDSTLAPFSSFSKKMFYIVCAYALRNVDFPSLPWEFQTVLVKHQIPLIEYIRTLRMSTAK